MACKVDIYVALRQGNPTDKKGNNDKYKDT